MSTSVRRYDTTALGLLKKEEEKEKKKKKKKKAKYRFKLSVART